MILIMRDWFTLLFMEAEKSHDLPSVNWRPRKVVVVVPVQTQRPKNQRS